MKCSAEWEIGIAFGTWYEFELKPNLELNLEPRMKLRGCLDKSLEIAGCSLFVVAKNVNFNSWNVV